MNYIISWIESLDLRGLNEISVALRLSLAVLCGSLIGLEREQKQRPAGFRTHIIICLGAALTMLTTQYLQTLKYISPDNFVSDPARLGAQVISGIGFIGAGTIIVTRRKQVKGLTTAAGLWTTAVLGLAIGVGCYEIAIYATLCILIAEILFSKIEWHIVKSARSLNIYVEMVEDGNFNNVIELLKKYGAKVVDVEITKARAAEGPHISAIFCLTFKNKIPHEPLMNAILEIEGVRSAEEL
ncbi:MAG: MgtC/SapB family protein [Clostridia bacterium]|nr:MgtC/SapB family protein [Clostridia bacterium]